MIDEKSVGVGEHLTNRAFRAVLLGVEEVVGVNGMAAVLREASLAQYIGNYPPSDLMYGGHSPQSVTQISQAIAAIYGSRGYRAILFRIGRSQAKSGIQENSALASTMKLALNLLPARRKVRLVLETAAKEANAQMGRQSSVGDDGESVFFEDAICIYCIGMQAHESFCHSIAGFVHGLVEWATDGQDFKVEEVACRAQGAPACKVRVKLNA